MTPLSLSVAKSINFEKKYRLTYDDRSSVISVCRRLHCLKKINSPLRDMKADTAVACNDPQNPRSLIFSFASYAVTKTHPSEEGRRVKLSCASEASKHSPGTWISIRPLKIGNPHDLGLGYGSLLVKSVRPTRSVQL